MRLAPLAPLVSALLLGACTSDRADTGTKPDPDEDGGLTLSLAKVPTVLLASWTTAEPTLSVVTARFDGETRTFTEAEATTDHAVTLIGFPSLTDVTVEVTAEGDDASPYGSITTGPLPRWVPSLSLVADAPDAAEGGFTLVPTIFADSGGILVVDDAARVVWAWPVEADSMGLDDPPFRAVMSLDGTAVVFNQGAETLDKDGYIQRISLDGSEVTRIAVPTAHTDFVEYADDAYLALGWEEQTVDGRRFLGDTVREILPDGTQNVLWTVWDHYSPDLTRTYTQPYPEDADLEDWSHINGISYDPVDDDLYITASFNDSVMRIDHATGGLEWTLSDTNGGDFARSEGVSRVLWPHSVQRTDEGLTVFSRGNPGNPETCSWAVDLALDEVAFEATETWRYTSPDCLLVTFLGGAARLPGGNTLITWTTSGRIDEVTPEGDVAWEISTPIGSAFGFSTRSPTFGM
jgi:hypothetical protein